MYKILFTISCLIHFSTYAQNNYNFLIYSGINLANGNNLMGHQIGVKVEKSLKKTNSIAVSLGHSAFESYPFSIKTVEYRNYGSGISVKNKHIIFENLAAVDFTIGFQKSFLKEILKPHINIYSSYLTQSYSYDANFGNGSIDLVLYDGLNYGFPKINRIDYGLNIGMDFKLNKRFSYVYDYFQGIRDMGQRAFYGDKKEYFKRHQITILYKLNMSKKDEKK